MNLVGMTFDDYKVIEFDNTKGKYKYYYICECAKCGNRKSIAYGSLTRHLGTLCCTKREKHNKGYSEDLVGQKFGNLIVDSFAYVKDAHSHWNCTCKLCGSKCIRNVTYIKRSKNPMCQQCAMDFGNDDIKENKIKYKDGYCIVNDNVLIDKDDLDNILTYHRYISVNSSGYAYFRYKGAYYFLHRLIMGLPTKYDNETKLIIDHINGNRLDNRKSNLRVCHKSKNPINCKKYKNNTSGCKWVTWMKRLNKWQVAINVNKKNIYLGVYSDLNEAIAVRREAEKKYFGEFTRDE